jgi:hypothetical protein
MGSEKGNDACPSRIKKKSEEKDDDNNESQALRRSNKSNKQREWKNLVVKSLHNNGKQWASNTNEESKLLDNRSMLSLFGNPKMVTNIRESKTTLDLATNDSTRITKKSPTYLDMVRYGMTKPQLQIYSDYPN